MVRAMLDAPHLLLSLTTFNPGRTRASAEVWRGMAELAPLHGVAPLVGHNLEYRLGGADAPPEVRDSLLGHYQGAMADNVYKLVNLRQMLSLKKGLPVLLLDAVAAADTLYPHVAYRPMGEIRLLVHPPDLPALLETLGQVGFVPSPGETDPLGGAVITSDQRTEVIVHTSALARDPEVDGIWKRSVPAAAYGPGVRRPGPEDALLTALLFRAKQGFDVPLVTMIDLRELVRGAPELGGPYSRPLDIAAIRARVSALKLNRSLWVAMSIVARLFPEVSEPALALAESPRPATRMLLDRAVISPACDLHRSRAFRGAERLRRLLSGGG